MSFSQSPVITDLWEFIQDPENQKHYSAWLNDPFTQLMLNSAKAECEPMHIPVEKITEGGSTYLHGIHVGEFRHHRRFTHLLDRVDTENMSGDVQTIRQYLAETAPGVKFTDEEIKEFRQRLAKGES